MALTLRNSFPVSGNGESPRVVATPTGTMVSDLLLLLVVTQQDVIPTPPPGFILVPGAVITGATATRVYQKIATSSEPTEYAIHFPGGGAANVGLVAIDATSLLYAGVHQVATASTSTPSTNKVWSSVTNSVADTLLLCFGGFASTGATTPDGAMTERMDGVGNSNRPYLMTQVIAATGVTGTRTATGSNATLIRTITISVEETNTKPFDLPVEANVTSLPILVEMQGESVRITSLPVLAEIAAVGVYVTALPVLVEMEYELLDQYAVAEGHNIPASFLTPLDPQPALEGVLVTRRTLSHTPTLQDEARYLQLRYSALEGIEQYHSLLDQYGVKYALENEITITARDQDQIWKRWNGTVMRPQLGQDGGWSDFFLRDIIFVVKDLSEAL